MHRALHAFVFVIVALAVGCGSSKHNPDATPGGDDGAMECTAEGDTRCQGATYETCHGGAWDVTQQCGMICDPSLGCVACAPGIDYCVGNDIHSCDGQGQDTGLVMACGANARSPVCSSI